jgi:hypothetical protein
MMSIRMIQNRRVDIRGSGDWDGEEVIVGQVRTIDAGGGGDPAVDQ